LRKKIKRVLEILFIFVVPNDDFYVGKGYFVFYARYKINELIIDFPDFATLHTKRK